MPVETGRATKPAGSHAWTRVPDMQIKGICMLKKIGLVVVAISVAAPAPALARGRGGSHPPQFFVPQPSPKTWGPSRPVGDQKRPQFETPRLPTIPVPDRRPSWVPVVPGHDPMK